MFDWDNYDQPKRMTKSSWDFYEVSEYRVGNT